MKKDNTTILAVIIAIFIALVLVFGIFSALIYGLCWGLGVAFSWRYVVLASVVWYLFVAIVDYIKK
jgi:hypothetical protein